MFINSADLNFVVCKLINSCVRYSDAVGHSSQYSLIDSISVNMGS